MDDRAVCLHGSNGCVVMKERDALLSVTIANLVGDVPGIDDIPVPSVTKEILEKVSEYCIRNAGVPQVPSLEQEREMRETPISGWDREFVDVPLATLFHLILAANYLDIKSMLNLTCKAVAEMIKGKTVEQVRQIFGIEGDFTEAERIAVLAEHEWLRAEGEAVDE